MNVYILQHITSYDGNVILGIYGDKVLAQEALRDYVSQEDNEDTEPFLKIVKVSMNDKPNSHFTNPELQEIFKKLNYELN